MSLYERKPNPRQDVAANAGERSPAYKRLSKDLSFDTFIQILRQETVPSFETATKSLDYHRRRYGNLSDPEKLALHDELILECLNSPHRLEPIGVTNDTSLPFSIGMFYIKVLADTLDLKSLPISNSLSADVLGRLRDRIASPVGELQELNDLTLLPMLLPDDSLDESSLSELIDNRINWELENNFERIQFLISIDIFQERLPIYRSDKTNQAHVVKCILKFLESKPDTWMEIADREMDSLGDDEDDFIDPLGISNLPPPQLIAGVISSFKVFEILNDQKFLDLVNKAIDRELIGNELFGVNSWIATLERCSDGVSRISQRSYNLLNTRKVEIQEMIVCLIDDNDFNETDLSIIRETCRNFKIPEVKEIDTFCEAIKTAITKLAQENCSIFKLDSLFRLVPQEKRNEMLSDPDFSGMINRIYNRDRKDFNRRMKDLKEGEGVISFQFRELPSIKNVILLYREKKALVRAAQTLSHKKNNIATCPVWVTVLGKAHTILNDRIEQPLKSGKKRQPEEVTVLGASWEQSLDYTRGKFREGSLDLARSLAKQLVIEAKRLDQLHNRIDDIHEALELLAVSQTNEREKHHKFRAAIVFGMRNLGLLSLKVGESLTKYADFLEETYKPNETMRLLAKLIENYNNPKFPKENKQETKNLIKEIYQDQRSLSEELGFEPFWFYKILKNCSY